MVRSIVSGATHPSVMALFNCEHYVASQRLIGGKSSLYATYQRLPSLLFKVVPEKNLTGKLRQPTMD